MACGWCKFGVGVEDKEQATTNAKTKYGGSSPFDFAQGQNDIFFYLYSICEAALVRGGDPKGVGVEEEEEDHAEGHEIHVDEKEDAAVIETPAPLHAANGVRGAGGGGEGGEDEDWRCVDLREAGEEDGCEQAGQDKQDAA